MAIADESYFDWAALPEAPASLRCTRSSGRVRLVWDLPGRDIKGVVVERRDGEHGEWRHTATLQGPITEHTDLPRAAARSVYYRVRAVSDAGESAYSNIVKVKEGQ